MANTVLKRNHPRLKRWLKRGLLALGGLSLLLMGFGLWVYLTCFATPPDLDGRPPILDETVSTDESGRARLGASWFRRDEGCSLLYLEGDPFAIGYANATLTADFLEEQERSLMHTVRRFFPSRLSFLAVGVFVLVNNRNLPSYVPDEYRYEILGLSRGGTDPFPEYGPRYHRILNYHAAHDIAHMVWDRPVLGCTAFALRGPRTADGHLLVARNFDFEAGRHFDTNKIIGLYRPEKGRRFISVSWPGMAGAVTGLNEDRVFCSINGAHSEDRRNIGRPVSLVVREVLQYARSLDEAVRIVRQATVFVSDSYLIADGKTNDAVVVEKSPARVEVRRMIDDAVLQANHFEAPGFADDAGNRESIEKGTTVARRERLAELLEAHRGKVTPATAVDVLRDRKGAGGRKLAAGHRGAINPMIATHAVVADLTSGILWVSRGPHQLGTFEAFSIESFGAAAAPSIPEDPALRDGVYERVCEARALVERAAGEMENLGRLSAERLEELRRALELNPGDPQALYLLGRALASNGETKQALATFEAALDARPPFLEHRRRLEAAIERLR